MNFVSNNSNDIELLEQIHASVKAIRAELAKKIIAQHEVIDNLLCCLLAGGHCLLVGVPGLAKTTLIRSLAQCLKLEFNRVQFTPDLMPSDITGSEILVEDRLSGTREFRFVKGPVFTNVLLADEINRTPPKTQSALLQAMQEYEITSSGRTFKLPRPFWVLATQNPIEQEGTYPLPEAQQDRFMFSIEIDYPCYSDEVAITKMSTREQSSQIIEVVSADQILKYHELILRIPVADSVIDYAVRLVRASRPSTAECPQNLKTLISWGAGPRASSHLILAAKTFAALDGRPTPDASDVRKSAQAVLRHRLVRSFHAEAEGIGQNEIVKMILEHVKE